MLIICQPKTPCKIFAVIVEKNEMKKMNIRHIGETGYSCYTGKLLQLRFLKN